MEICLDVVFKLIFLNNIHNIIYSHTHTHTHTQCHIQYLNATKRKPLNTSRVDILP